MSTPIGFASLRKDLTVLSTSLCIKEHVDILSSSSFTSEKKSPVVPGQAARRISARKKSR
jgi:hypothetical protein